MKNRKFMALCCSATALALAVVVYAGEPAKPAKDVKDAAKDAAKQVKDAAKEAAKDVKDAAKGAVDKAKEMTEADGGMPPSMASYMEVSDHHKKLAEWVGEWDITSKFWIDPSMPPQENKMVASTKATMGGRYFIEKVSGKLMMGPGEPPMDFEGMSMFGYDNHKKMHFSTWCDNMTTGLWMEWGTCSADGKVLTLEGENYDSMEDKMKKTRSVTTIIDANNRKMEMFTLGADGKAVKTMELVYVRKK